MLLGLLPGRRSVDDICPFLQSAVARALVERLFQNSGYNVRLYNDELIATEETIKDSRYRYGFVPYFIVYDRKGDSEPEIIDVRFRSGGELNIRSDLPRYKEWGEYNAKRAFRMVVVCPYYEPHFRALSASNFEENGEAPSSGEYTNVLNVEQWNINHEVHTACIEALKQFFR